MADGIECAHCGHDESSHYLLRRALLLEEGEKEENPDEREDEGDVADVLDEIPHSRKYIEGYSHTLLTCPQYLSSE